MKILIDIEKKLIIGICKASDFRNGNIRKELIGICDAINDEKGNVVFQKIKNDELK